jgi:D-alanine-D-alanine ligase
VPINAGTALDKAVEEKVDVVFIAMHGPLGEDGTVQGLLELADIPYTGSGVLASSLAMNKVMSGQLFQHNGLNVPQSLVFTVWDWDRSSSDVVSKVKEKLGFPCVLKPVELGSSVGISIAKTDREFKTDFQNALRYSNEVLVEEYLDGKEVTCAVLGAAGGEEPIPLIPTEIVPKTSKFFDYEAKYTPGATEEITPPRDISDEMYREIQKTAVRAHKILGCGGMSRTDMIIRNGTLYVLELNTIPGMTEVSLYPQAARAAGIDFPELLSRLTRIAIETHKLKKRCTD